jgi:hypothetical protein
MENKHLEQLAALQDIKSMMERSNRFLSLSGLSGIWTGFCALAGVTAMYIWLKMPNAAWQAANYIDRSLGNQNWGLGYRGAFLVIGVCTALMALLGVFFFNYRKAKQLNHSLWDASAQRMVYALLTPLVIGAVFCIALARYDLIGLIAPSTLVFYGLALIHSDKHTIGNVRILGILQVCLGLFGLFFPYYGLHLWAFGFGILHILYGTWMYLKFEKKA